MKLRVSKLDILQAGYGRDKVPDYLCYKNQNLKQLLQN